MVHFLKGTSQQIVSDGLGVILIAVYLERLASGLRYEEIHPEQGQQTEHSEEDVCAKACVLDQRRRDEANDEVEEPIGGG